MLHLRSGARAAIFAAAVVAVSSPAIAQPQLVFMHELGDAKHVVMANADGTGAHDITPDGEWGLYPDISSDGRFVSYSSGASESALGISVRDLSGGVLERWTPQDGLYLHSKLSGDGRYLAFSGPVGTDGAQRVAVIDLSKERLDVMTLKGPTDYLRDRLGDATLWHAPNGEEATAALSNAFFRLMAQ